MTKPVFGLLLVFSVLTLAASAATKTPPPPTRGKITNVDQSSMTVTAQLTPGAKPITFTVNDQSTIEINDKSSTIKQLKPGLFIRSIRLDSGSPPSVEDLDLTSASD